jgi:BMFP domain-containing protein YqiC
MSTPEQKIAALEARIGKLEAEYDAATDNDEKRQLRELITETRKTLNRY